MAAAAEVPELALQRYELTFRVLEPVRLPPFAGAMWHGVFGRALKLIADGEAPAPADCPVAGEALYDILFRAAPSGGGRTLPPPYVLDASASPGAIALAAGEVATLQLTLVGRANGLAAAALFAFELAAAMGLGAGRGRARLDRADAVWCNDPCDDGLVYAAGRLLRAPPALPPLVPPMPSRLEVALVSPLRLRRELGGGRRAPGAELAGGRRAPGADLAGGRPGGKRAVLSPDELRPGHLLRALLRRLANLGAFYGDGAVAGDWRRSMELAGGARMLDRALRWHDQVRWSTRQRQEQAMGGIVGSLFLDMRGLEPLWPSLWLAPWIHLGNGTSMGLGAVRLAPA